jgi:RNA polymerase-binding transcription factor DksA
VSSIDTDAYRELLIAERERLTKAVDHLHGDNSSSIEDELGELSTAGVDNHMADTASATYERELDAGLEEGAQHALEAVEAALARIDAGTYGLCEACGQPIVAERLSAIPWARLCIDDQRRSE